MASVVELKNSVVVERIVVLNVDVAFIVEFKSTGQENGGGAGLLAMAPIASQNEKVRLHIKPTVAPCNSVN